MARLRVALGLLAATAFIGVAGPLRRVAQQRGWRFGRSTPVSLHRILCAALNVRVRRWGAPATTGRRLIVANHVSWLDIPIMGALEPMTFLAKKEIGGPWLARQLAALQGIVYVDRERRRCIPGVNAAMAEAMRAGEPVVLYAEATTGDGNRLLRFRSSHFEAARLAAREGEAVVQPVFLHYARVAGLPITRAQRPLVAWYGDMTFLPHLRDYLSCGGLVCDVHYGEPIPVSAFADRKSLARATQRAVGELSRQARRPSSDRLSTRSPSLYKGSLAPAETLVDPT